MAVIMNTSVGDIVIDLHTELCPLTSKNFLKLCKMKYYSHCLFHDVKKDFIAQTGDPTGTGSGGDSLYKHLYGDQARFFNDEIHPKLTHGKIGTVAMASAGENLNASQFYITLRAGLDYLDGKHTVFGEVAEGLDTLMRINEAFIDDKGRPLKNIRIKRVDILDDPFDDPSQLAELIPDMSPELRPPAEGEDIRLEDDWVPMDERMDPEELDKSLRKKEAHSRAVVLEMIGDIPEAEVAPPENVLFICKLNPVTEEGDLETIFSRFGKIVSADIIRDYKTGESLCYGFIEFENKEACEAAYFKMDNVLIDDRRIHVDFSQSVAKLWTRFRKFGTKDTVDQGKENSVGGGCFICGELGHRKKDCPHAATHDSEKGVAHVEKPKYTLKESGKQRGNPRTRYDMVFGDDAEDSLPDKVKDSANTKDSRLRTAKHSDRFSEDRDDGRRMRGRTGGGSPDNWRYRDGRHERSRYGHRKDHGDSDDERRKSRSPLLSKHVTDDRNKHSERNEKHRDGLQDEGNPDLKERSDSRISHSQRHGRPERHWEDRQHLVRNGHHGERLANERSDRDRHRRREDSPSDHGGEKHGDDGPDIVARNRPQLASRGHRESGRYHSTRSDRERTPPSDENRKEWRRSPSPRRERHGERTGREQAPPSDEDRKESRRSLSPRKERHGERREKRRERTLLSDENRMVKRSSPSSGRERYGGKNESRRKR